MSKVNSYLTTIAVRKPPKVPSNINQEGYLLYFKLSYLVGYGCVYLITFGTSS